MATGYYTSQYFTTTLAVVGGITDSQTTGIVLQSVTGIQSTAKPGIALLSYADPLNETTAEWIKFNSINSTTKELVGVTRGAEKGSAKAHSNGVTVAFPISESHINPLVDAVSIGGAATNISQGVLDEDDMATNSATKLATQQSIKAYVDTQDTLYTNYNIGMARQAIINGNFDVWQRGTSFTASANNDDVYTADRWNLISDGNDAVDVSREAVTDLAGSTYAIKLDTETAKRYGIVQFIENVDAIKLKGKTVSLSFKAKSANIAALRATVLTWASTADAVTSDVVASWDATPTWAANWADNATPADLAVGTSWTTCKVEGIVLDESTVNNVAVVIWTPNEETIGDIVYVSQIQLNEGSVALPFQPKSFEEELRACKRFCYRMTSADAAYTPFGTGQAYAATNAAIRFYHPIEMRIKPTLTYSAAADFVLTTNVDGAVAVTGVTANIDTKHSSTHNFEASGGGLTAGNSSTLLSNNKTTAWIQFTSEL